MSKYLKLFSDIILILVFAAGAVILYSKFSGKNLFGIYVVSSGSMEPAVKTGSLVIVQPQPDYLPGDIITFKSGQTTVTHRLLDIRPKGLLTMGDANNSADSALVQPGQVLGRVAYALPRLGYLAAFAKTPPGFILFVIVPATIIIYEELKFIVSEIKKRLPPISTPLIRNTLYAIPFLAAAVIVIPRSGSFFSDTETSSGNVFTAFVTTPTPTPLHLVINEVYYDTGNRGQGQNREDEGANEWVELYNPTDSPVNVQNWKITDNSGTLRTIATSNTFVNPHCFAVISKAANTFTFWSIPTTCSNGETVEKISIGEIIGNGLSNDGDQVVLTNSGGVEIDKMSYGTDTGGFNPPAPDVSEGHSLERNPDGTDTNTAADFTDTNPPTPGT